MTTGDAILLKHKHRFISFVFLAPKSLKSDVAQTQSIQCSQKNGDERLVSLK